MTYGLPPQASQVVSNSLKVGFTLPAATLVLPGVVYGATVLPEVSPALGSAVQSAAGSAAIRATTDYLTGNRSSSNQYLGDAAVAAGASIIAGPRVIVGAVLSGGTSLASNYIVNKSVDAKQTAGTVAGAVAGQITTNLLKSAPASFSMTSGSLVNYAVTAISTVATLAR
jgi:hypothetical protein